MDSAPHETDAESLIETEHTSQSQRIHGPWRASLDGLWAQVNRVSPQRFACLVGVLTGLLLIVSAALLWSISRSESPDREANACSSFFLNIAVGNVVNWVVPTGCAPAVKDYIQKGQYELDFAAAVDSVQSFVASQGPPGQDGLDLWILDIDETSLSNVPFFEQHTNWGTEEWTADVQALWDEWVMAANAAALTPTFQLFKEMRVSGWQVAFITGRAEAQRNATTANLLAAGYSGWQSLTLRSPSELHEPAAIYKSRHRQDLASQGYRILGGMGDQWSDLQGPAAGNRTFKLPNPLYYVG